MNLNSEYLLKALSEFAPEPESFVIRGELLYENIEWTSKTRPKPTKTQVKQKIEELSDKEPYRILRKHRDILLKECDWTVFPDSPLSPELKNKWIEYRQLLRDLPENSRPEMDGPFIKNVNWPQTP